MSTWQVVLTCLVFLINQDQCNGLRNSSKSHPQTSIPTHNRRKNYSPWLKGNFEALSVRLKRPENRHRACEMLIAIDEPFYRLYDQNMEIITSLVEDYVAELNEIYFRTFLTKDRGFEEIYFRLKEIRILFDFCVDCNETQSIFLNEFTKMDTSDFCLAHIFTYRDFPDGVQGLAWKSTICHRRHNTGFTTFLNHQVRSTREDAIMTFAHEIGHNLGAHHDQDVGCPEGFIMSQSGSKRSFKDHQFSNCSLYNMTKQMNSALRNYPKCFVEKKQTDPQDFSFCGNYIVEGDEECDCGLSYLHCDDPCCYAAHIDPADLTVNHSAVPCRSNQKRICLYPLESIWQYGFLAPWITILVVGILSAVLLLYDWKNDRHCYTHVTEPKELIRSETTEQMNKRLQRQKKSENGRLKSNVFVIPNSNLLRSSSNVRPREPPPPPPSQQIPDYIPPPPSAPPPPPPAFVPPAPLPKDYPSEPFLGHSATSHKVRAIKSRFEHH